MRIFASIKSIAKKVIPVSLKSQTLQRQKTGKESLDSVIMSGFIDWTTKIDWRRLDLV